MAVTMDWLSREKMTGAWRWGIPLIVAIVVLDQLSKAWVLATPEFRALDCLPDDGPCGRIEMSSVLRLLDDVEPWRQLRASCRPRDSPAGACSS